MKKSELITLLSEIKGNPEVLMWNPTIGEWHPIKGAEKFVMHRWSFEHFRDRVIYELRKELRSWSVRIFDSPMQLEKEWNSKNKFDFNPYLPESRAESRELGYDTKVAYILNPKARGEETFDRLGPISF